MSRPVEPEGGPGAGDLVDDLDAGEEAAGEDVLVDPGVAVAGGEHPVVRHRDRLDGDPAAGRQHPVDGAEVGAPELVADGLDHLHGHHGVVRRTGGGERAVVHQLDLDAVGEPGRGDPLLGELELLDRQRDRVDARATPGGTDGELAPAGADLQDPGAGGDAGLVEEAFDLAALRVREVGAVDGGVPVVGGLWWSGDQLLALSGKHVPAGPMGGAGACLHLRRGRRGFVVPGMGQPGVCAGGAPGRRHAGGRHSQVGGTGDHARGIPAGCITSRLEGVASHETADGGVSVDAHPRRTRLGREAGRTGTAHRGTGGNCGRGAVRPSDFATLGGIALLLLWNDGMPVAAVPVETYRLVASPVLPSMPLFTFAGYLLVAGGASERLLRVYTALSAGFRRTRRHHCRSLCRIYLCRLRVPFFSWAGCCCPCW